MLLRYLFGTISLARSHVLEVDDLPVGATVRHRERDDRERLRKRQLLHAAPLLYQGRPERTSRQSRADKESVSSLSGLREAGRCVQPRLTIVERLYVQLTKITVVHVLKERT